MAVARKRDPYKGYNYRVEFVGKTNIAKTGFSFVSAVRTNIEYEEQEEGGKNDGYHQIPTKPRYDPVEMMRGVTNDAELIEAFANQYDPRVGFNIHNPFTVVITLLAEDGRTPVRETILYGATMSEYEQPELNALESTALIDRIVVTFDSVDVNYL